MDRNKVACHCKSVTYGKIADAVANGADTLQKVSDATGACKGCGGCKDFVDYLVRDIKEQSEE